MNGPQGGATPAPRPLLARLYHGETSADFVGRWKLWFAISGVLILIGIGSLLARGGLNLGIDFTGGNVWQVRNSAGVSVADATEAIEKLGIDDTKIQTVGDDLRVQTPPFTGSNTVQQGREAEVVETLSDLTGTSTADVEANQNTVGPSWGDEISEKAIRALVIFLVAITIYITLRFEIRMAVATLAALFHDLLIVLGAYALLQLPVTPATVIAILTILGFSIYDGIVVFDRVDENTRLLATGARMTYTDMTNLSLNQVLMRSLNTQITALLPIVSLLVVGSVLLGATTLQEFGLALFLGQLSGAYSSIFIASPVLALLKEREPRYRALRKRLDERGERVARRTTRTEMEADLAEADAEAEAGAGIAAGTEGPTSPAAPVGASAGSRSTSTGSTGTGRARAAAPGRRPAAGPASANHPPRPRKKGKKR